MDWSSFSIGNAAGFIKGPGIQFDNILRSAATHVTIGSITLEKRDGNPGNVYHLESDGTSINSLGLPNPGLALTSDASFDLSNRVLASNKGLWFSIAGFNPGEYFSLFRGLSGRGRIEFNLGCPNVWGKDGQKPIASFDLDLMDEIFRLIRFLELPFRSRVKVSPYSDPVMLSRVANLFREYKDIIDSVVVCNTFPNGVAFQDGKCRILDTEGGFGGVAGNALHLIALGQVSQFSAALEGSGIGVIGVGGINSGERLLAMKSAGATGIQIGTAYGERGAKVFSDILEEASFLGLE